MTEYRHVLCLFCKAGKEQSVAEHIHEHGYGRAIFSQKVKRVLNKNTRRWEDEFAPLLPGYVFLYCVEAAVSRETLLAIQNVIRILTYQNGDSGYLWGRDLEFAQWLWQTNGCIERLKVVEVGERIEIAEGAFKSMRGIIRRVDRRRQTCQIEIDARSIIKSIWLPYEIVEPYEV